MWNKRCLTELAFILMFSIVLAACGADDNNTNASESPENNESQNENTETDENKDVELGKKELTIPYVAWARETVVSYLMGEVLKDIGYNVEVKQVETGPMWASVADGTADFTASAWLPKSQKQYWDQYKNQVEEVNQTLDKAPLALTVPSYMEDIDSVEDLKDNTELGKKLNWKITGIDSGAGIMSLTKKAIDQYGLEQWDLRHSSEAAMITELKSAIENKKPIVVTLWKPHWTFGVMDLKMLNDPKGSYGGNGGHISIVANKNLEDDAPAAYKFINQYTESYEMIEKLMPKVFAEDKDPKKVARQFINDNPELIDEWTKGIQTE
ncbi:glycine betaine ABC transporter substrate-binding protein [Lentibacillus halophilus]